MIYNSKEFYTDFIKEYPNIDITLQEYTAIVTEFNYNIGEKIIYAFYSFYFGFTLGYLKLLRCNRNFGNPVINFGESNKIKKKLIAEGKVPAKKIGMDEKGNPIFDNENLWMVFYTDDFYPLFYFHKLVKSSKNKKDIKYNFNVVKNINYWKFTVLRTLSARMYEAIKTNKIKVENLKKATVRVY